jgi:hypothetical protein
LNEINTEEIKIRVESRQCASTAEGLRVLLAFLSAARSEDWSSRASFLTSEADLMLLWVIRRHLSGDESFQSANGGFQLCQVTVHSNDLLPQIHHGP